MFIIWFIIYRFPIYCSLFRGPGADGSASTGAFKTGGGCGRCCRWHHSHRLGPMAPLADWSALTTAQNVTIRATGAQDFSSGSSVPPCTIFLVQQKWLDAGVLEQSGEKRSMFLHASAAVCKGSMKVFPCLCFESEICSR